MVKRCLNKFKENGVEAALRDSKGRGRKAEITDDDITWVISKAGQKPKDYGYSAEFWYPMSFRKFINSIAEAEGHSRMATVAETTLRKILSNARIKPFQVSYYYEKCNLNLMQKCMMFLLSTSRLKCSLTRMKN